MSPQFYYKTPDITMTSTVSEAAAVIKAIKRVSITVLSSLMMILAIIILTLLLFSPARSATPAAGQIVTPDEDAGSNIAGAGLSISVNNYGIAFGHVPVINGLRFNFRDINLNRVHGMNITIVAPREPSYGTVRGIAIGLPMTGAANMTGVSAAFGGITVNESLRGIQVALLGIGAGSGISGITAAGLGFGADGDVRGLNFAGLGLGADGHISGITVAGLGFGADGNVTGLNIAGLGFGSDGNIAGINLAGLGFGADGNITGLNFTVLGFGAGGSVRGINLAGLGIASGENISGINISGLGIASGNYISGISLSGFGIASQRLFGLTISPAAGARDLAMGAFIAPAYFRIEEGTLKGVSISAFNHIRGNQHGLTIGIYNYARKLSGIQIGLLNYAANNPRGLRLLPLANANL